MKVITTAGTDKRMEGENIMKHEYKRPLKHPISPHERRAMMQIEFDENDWKRMNEIFGDEDTAAAAAEIIKEAPPEIQILAVQLINFIEEVA